MLFTLISEIMYYCCLSCFICLKKKNLIKLEFFFAYRKLTCIQSRKKISLSVLLSSCTVDEMITSMPLLLFLLLSLHTAIKEQDSQLVSLLINSL